MPFWSDLYRLLTFADEQDPLARRKDRKQFSGAGVSSPDALHTLGAEGAAGAVGGGTISYRQTNDMIDVTSLTNRTQRYKEYERLRNVPEIEQVMTIIADEACVAGNTNISTPFGNISIEKLAAEKDPDERFLVYAWNFEKSDYTLGWAWNPRKVKTAKTIKIAFDDGTHEVVTPDHEILLRDEKWVEAGELKFGDEIMPFYRIPANQNLTKIKINQFPRIYSHEKGWVHERQFVDEWRKGKTTDRFRKINKACRLIAAGVPVRKIGKLMGHDYDTIENWIKKEGFSLKELRYLQKHNEDRKRIVGVFEGDEIDVYDLSVEEHMCFCTNNVVMHNCQRDETDNLFKIECHSEEVKKEIKFLLLHRNMLNLNRTAWNWFKNLLVNGDWFLEMVINPDNPKEGIYKAVSLPVDSMYRIETTKGKLIEFQQSKEGPDYQALTKAPVTEASEEELMQSKAVRFAPGQIVHMRIGDDRKSFYPYGQSLIEPARGPAHQLRLMEDAMVVYRLTRAPERRVFYVDVGQLPPFKAEAFIDRLKDQFRKRKIASGGMEAGASTVEERWQPPAQDEDYWLPIRPNSNTRIETLPGAQNLGEIDDAIYFRNKLFTALNFPKNYFSNDDPNATRITLSAQDVKFARMIERLQSHFVDGILEICERHLKLRGFPEEATESLVIHMTPPSDWRELSRQEVVTARIGNATQLKSGQLMADYDIYTRWMLYTDSETEEMLSRLKLQKLEDLKLQVLAQNPALLGIGIPGADQAPGQELGAQPGGPAAMPAPPMPGEVALPMPGMAADEPPDPGEMPPDEGAAPAAGPTPGPGQPPQEGGALPEAEDEDIKKYDMEIQDYETEQDEEDIDYSVAED
jgi:hypothetical protein